MELRQYSGLIWRWKWLLLLCTLIAAVAAFIVSSLTAPVYEASTMLLINQAPDSQTSDLTGILTSERLARTYARLLTTRPVLEETLRRVELGLTPGQLESAVRVQLIADTQLIELKVQNSRPDRASDLANVLVAVFREQNDALQASRFAASKTSLGAQLEKISEQIQASEAALGEFPSVLTEGGDVEFVRLQSELSRYQASYTNLLQSYEGLRIAEARSISNIIQVEPAEAPQNPIRPRTLLHTTLAAAVGAMFAVGAIFLIEYLDDTMRSVEDVARITQLPVFGFVADSGKLSASETRQRLMISQPNSQLAESFRSLRTNLELAGSQGTPRSILVSSPEPGDGKTTIAAQLAVSIAQGGKRVFLIDANMRQPRLHEYFGIESKLGFSDMLVDDLVPQVVAQEVIHWRLKLITSGKRVDNPAELVSSIWMLKVLARLREQADVAIFDGAPLLVAESSVLASKLESTLMVIRYGRTREAVVTQTIEQLNRVQANIFGIVMNRAPVRLANRLSSNLVHGYGQNSSAPSPAKNPPSPVRGQVVLRRQPADAEAFIEERNLGTDVPN